MLYMERYPLNEKVARTFSLARFVRLLDLISHVLSRVECVTVSTNWVEKVLKITIQKYIKMINYKISSLNIQKLQLLGVKFRVILLPLNTKDLSQVPLVQGIYCPQEALALMSGCLCNFHCSEGHFLQLFEHQTRICHNSWSHTSQ